MRRLVLLAGLVIGFAWMGLAQEAKPTDTSASQPPIVTDGIEPPFHSLKQLKAWIDREKQRAKQRLEELEKSGVHLDPKQRYKLEEGPEYAEALWDYLYVRAYPN
ncbi:MAG: hypothetical protein RMK45_08065, partial [Armatimonadota bacterium]|nr:hypothetical protein [Armatimonadota bacterium]